MRYKKFTLKNFKGVERAVIQLTDGAGANVVTLIGLNESGKTTILEGVYSFSPDQESKNLFDDQKMLGPDVTSRIPRGKLYNFSDEICIEAAVTLEEGEKEVIIAEMAKKLDVLWDSSVMPEAFNIKDATSYSNSKIVGRKIIWAFPIQVKSKKAQKWRAPTPEENKIIFSVLQPRLPSIAYFPTFLSEVPAKIYLSGREGDQRNTFYKKVFQDILSTLGNDITIESQILERLKPPATFAGSVAEAIATFLGSDSKSMVQQVIDKASAQLSKVIVTRWNEMFENKPVGKEIVIEWGIEEDHKIAKAVPYVSFAVRDGANRFNIADRSLGFRWFFCFLLFAQFRAQRRKGAGTLFLFDEPASNLHAKAQEKLLDSFRDVCKHPNALIYSTHSPYMINPMWMDSAYIVENTMIGADLEDIGAMNTAVDTSIVARKYHDFVELSPERMSHFQPVLDRLEVKPDLMQVRENSVLVEGKSDYVILSALFKKLKTKFHLVPVHGAHTMGPLISLLKGWGWPFAILLDSDKAGKIAKLDYEQSFNISGNIYQLSDFDKSLKAIESLVISEDLNQISKSLNIEKPPSKRQIYHFFLEAEADGKYLNLKSRGSIAFKEILRVLNTHF